MQVDKLAENAQSVLKPKNGTTVKIGGVILPT